MNDVEANHTQSYISNNDCCSKQAKVIKLQDKALYIQEKKNMSLERQIYDLKCAMYNTRQAYRKQRQTGQDYRIRRGTPLYRKDF